MFQYDNDYTEANWRHEADARELAELDRDRRDMRETPMPPIQMRLNLTEEKCCDNPGNFTLQASFDLDPDTGYWSDSFYRCGGCGNLICEEDYAALSEMEERRRHLAEIMKREPVPVEPIRKEAA